MTFQVRLIRRAAALACGAVLAACATVPADDLLVSSSIVAELDRETGPVVEVSRFSAGRAGEVPPAWTPFVVSPFVTRTEYALAESNPSMVLEARAEDSASGLYRRIRIDPARHPIVEWRWRVVDSPAGADPRIPARDDSPARIVICFHGDAKRLDIEERTTVRFYKAFTGERLPYAMLMYVWASEAPVETVAASGYTSKIQMIVVDSGGRTGEWREFRRNVLEDYRRAFGEEPWDIVAVGVMTDADNVNENARTQYGDIVFRQEQ
jgi:hypothetical protein